MKDHFEIGAFTPKPVGYCKRSSTFYECDACAILNLLAWFIQATVAVTGSVFVIVLIIAIALGGIKF